jgi:hypothetical protein
MAGYSETLSNKLYIANSNTATPLIKGTFPNTDLTFTANDVNVIHPLGTSYGLYIQTSYNGNTDSWHFYQYSTKELALYYNLLKRGDFDTLTGAYTSISDRRYKKNILDIGSVLNKLMLVKVRSYNFKEQNDGDRKYAGIIAQDLQELFPEFVYYRAEDDTYTVDYAGLSTIAIKAVQEQQAEIDEMKRQIQELRELIQK